MTHMWGRLFDLIPAVEYLDSSRSAFVPGDFKLLRSLTFRVTAGPMVGHFYDPAATVIIPAVGRNNFDISLLRDFRIKERYTASFSARVSNALNHTQFLPGSYNMNLGTVQTTSTPSQGLVAGEGGS